MFSTPTAGRSGVPLESPGGVRAAVRYSGVDRDWRRRRESGFCLGERGRAGWAGWASGEGGTTTRWRSRLRSARSGSEPGLRSWLGR